MLNGKFSESHLLGEIMDEVFGGLFASSNSCNILFDVSFGVQILIGGVVDSEIGNFD